MKENQNGMSCLGVPETHVKNKKKANSRWLWGEEMIAEFLEILKRYKTQKEGENKEWDSDKVTLFEHTRKELAIVFDDFKPVRLTPPEKDVTDMTKGEYKKDEANRKGEQQLIKEGYKRVATKYKNLKAAFSKDVTEKLRSGSGKITAEHWQSCWYLWNGTPSTEPIRLWH